MEEERILAFDLVPAREKEIEEPRIDRDPIERIRGRITTAKKEKEKWEKKKAELAKQKRLGRWWWRSIVKGKAREGTLNQPWKLVYKCRELEELQEIGFSSLELLQFKERILDIEKATFDFLIEGIEHRGPWKIPAVDRTRVFSV